jgi:hypothetical protein
MKTHCTENLPWIQRRQRRRSEWLQWRGGGGILWMRKEKKWFLLSLRNCFCVLKIFFKNFKKIYFYFILN